VIFEVRVDGQPNTTAIITADKDPVQQWTRGESLPMNPGEHQLRFELAPFNPIELNILLTEGMRFRVVQAQFRSEATGLSPQQSPPVAISPTPKPTHDIRPTPSIVYPLLGVGGLGAAGFLTFASIGRSKESSLDHSCRPNCTDSDVKPMRTYYLMGDISLGVSAAALVTAGAYYLARRRSPPHRVSEWHRCPVALLPQPLTNSEREPSAA